MNSQVKSLFLEEKYFDAIVYCKQELQNDMENSDLWYSLFLAENDNYININFENLNNEMAFNKACELASDHKRKKYISEYNFYRNISHIPYMRQLYRYAQFEMKNSTMKILSKISNAKYSLNVENKDEFYDYLFNVLNKTSKPDLLHINGIITKLLYFITILISPLQRNMKKE